MIPPARTSRSMVVVVPRLMLAGAAGIVGGLLGWNASVGDVGALTFFPVLPVLALLTGILSTWSP